MNDGKNVRNGEMYTAAKSIHKHFSQGPIKNMDLQKHILRNLSKNQKIVYELISFLETSLMKKKNMKRLYFIGKKLNTNNLSTSG